MRVTMTTSAAARPGRVNEDFTGAVPTAAVLVDGAGIPGSESLCRHGVAWYATRLGGALLGLLSPVRDRGLPALLAEAIEQVTDAHRDTCDVTDVIAPSAAVAVLRLSGGLVDYAVLGDATVVLDRTDGTPLVVSDPGKWSSAGRTRPRSGPPPGGAPPTAGFSGTCGPTGTSRAASGWPRTIRGRRTRRSPEAVRSPGCPVPPCSATVRAASWTGSGSATGRR